MGTLPETTVSLANSHRQTSRSNAIRIVRHRLDLTVVVVTFNSATDIEACLASVSDAQVIVVDNASTDGTVELIRTKFPDVTLVALPVNLGLSKAFNVGWRLTRGGDILFLNPDATVSPDGLEKLSAHLERFPSAGIVAPRLIGDDGAPQDSARTFPSVANGLARRTPLGRTRWGQRALTGYLAPVPVAREECSVVDWVLGAAMLIRRQALEAIGGLDEAYFLYCEDTDLCARVWEAGFQVVYCPGVEFHHAYQRSSAHTLDVRSRAVRAHLRSTIRLAHRYPAEYFSGRGLGARTISMPVDDVA